MQAEPLPCPFCGQPPEVGPKDPKREGTAWGYVQCVNKRCPAGGNLIVRDGAQVCDERGTKAYQRLAVSRWNRYRLRNGVAKCGWVFDAGWGLKRDE